MSIGGNSLYTEPFEPLLPDTHLLPFDDVAALDAIDDTVAAVVVEPVQAEGGVRIPSPEFLPALRRRCDDGRSKAHESARLGLHCRPALAHRPDSRHHRVDRPHLAPPFPVQAGPGRRAEEATGGDDGDRNIHRHSRPRQRDPGL